MRDVKDLREFWVGHAGMDLALCTLVGKQGSSYRAVGAKKLIAQDGASCGLLSGGCLEGDIVRIALDRWDAMPFTQSFSTMSDEDRLLGYQAGCAGVIDIRFERHRADANGIDAVLPVEPFTLFILGCGADALPFADIAPALGWDVVFLDYRQGNTMPERDGIASRIVPLEEFGAQIPATERSAVVLMTHNYEADLDILAQLRHRDLFYFGCIGPRHRFDQMRADLKRFRDIDIDPDWAARVRAPAGLWQAYAPEGIALSIVADMQRRLDT